MPFGRPADEEPAAVAALGQRRRRRLAGGLRVGPDFPDQVPDDDGTRRTVPGAVFFRLREGRILRSRLYLGLGEAAEVEIQR